MTTPSALAESWWTCAGNGLVDGSLALLVLLALWWPLRRRLPPRLVCLLFLLPLLKVALPVAVPAPDWLACVAPSTWWAAEPRPLRMVWPGSADVAMDLALSPDAPPSEASGSSRAGGDRIRQGLFAGWVLGVALLGLRLLRAHVRTLRIVRGAARVDAATFPLDLDALRARAGVRGRVRWLVTDSVRTPAAGGLLLPFVLLPRGFAERLPPRQLAFVLLHELAHIRRRDVAFVLGQRLLQIVWFFHPAVWIASWLIDQHRELACDEDALARSGASRRECGEAFLTVAAWVHGRALEPTAALAMFESQRVLRRRLMQILTHAKAPSRWLTAAYLAFAAAITLPSAKADNDAFDFATLAPQDDDQRAEIEKLRKQIAELRKQQAELAKLLARTQRQTDADEKPARKARRVAVDHDAEHDDDADAGHERHAVVELEHGAAPGKRKVAVRGKDTKVYVVDDGEVRALDFVEGKPMKALLDGAEVRVVHGGEIVELGDRAVTVLRAGEDGEGVVARKGVKGLRALRDLKDLKDLEGLEVLGPRGTPLKIVELQHGGKPDRKPESVELPAGIRRHLQGRALSLPKVLRVTGEDGVKVIELDGAGKALFQGEGVRGEVRLEIDAEEEGAGKKVRKVKVRHHDDDDDDHDDDDGHDADGGAEGQRKGSAGEARYKVRSTADQKFEVRLESPKSPQVRERRAVNV